jgi:thiol-disulfide isomerase/thioredoxin
MRGDRVLYVCLAMLGPSIGLWAAPPFGTGFWVRLLHTDQVLDELQLSPADREQLTRLLDESDPAFWRAMRSRPADQAEQLGMLEQQISTRLSQLLSPTKRERFEQLVRRAQGSSYLASDEAAGTLSLSASQRTAIRSALEKAQYDRKALGATATPDQLRSLETDLARQLKQALKPEQQQQLVSLLGPAFDLGGITERGPQAPEVAQITQWYHTQPVTLDEHRGKVIALHFFAAGCINCIRNLPHYNRWAEQYPADDFVVIGIHTPETNEEKQLQYLEQKLQEYGIQYPVAHDGQSATWNAWHNTMWPTVYLIDRQGKIRTWWEGELNWQGATGDRQLAERIEQLLDETRPTVLTAKQ